jgi:hypothetical protein
MRLARTLPKLGNLAELYTSSVARAEYLRRLRLSCKTAK